MDDWIACMESELSRSGVDGSNMVVMGRSSGSWSALKFAENHKIRKLILLAPTFPIKEMYEMYEKMEIVEDQKEYILKFLGGKNGKGNIDIKKVNENVGEIVFIFSTNDPYIDLDASVKYVKANFPFARIMRVRDAGHFSADDGYTEFPKVMDEILAPVYLELSQYDGDFQLDYQMMLILCLEHHR